LPNNPKNMSWRRPGQRAPIAAQSKRWASGTSRPAPRRSDDARKNYERYVALARAEAQSGNTVAAENYYQHAEHYYRSMSSDAEAT
jgi:Domain of unknown function (DUF4167)